MKIQAHEDMSNATLKLISSSVTETLEFGRRIAVLLRPGDVVALIGDLGSGKTWLSKGIAFGLGVPEHEYVASPAFDIVHEYQGKYPVYHIDFYRLDGLVFEDELWIEEYVAGQGVSIIEWADKFIDQLTSSYLRVDLVHGGSEQRLMKITAIGERYRELVERLEV